MTPEEQAKAELDANILAGGGLGLDPENDPVVATTDWGLEIKFHNAGEYQGAGHLPGQKASNGNVSTAALKGYCYFTGGNYDGVTGLKWVIIGYSPTIITSTKVVLSTNLNIPDTTDAGNALKSASSKGLLMATQYKVNPIYTNAVSNAEIPAGCVLCISEKNLLNVNYNDNFKLEDSSGFRYGSRWSLSELRTTMSNLCEEDIANFDAIRAKIQTVDLNQYYNRNKTNSSSIAKDTSSDKFFALANSTAETDDQVVYNPSTYPQNYRLETYLGATYASHASKRISYKHNTTTAQGWWLRTGRPTSYSNAAHYVSAGGVVTYGGSSQTGVRPAFVLNVCT